MKLNDIFLVWPSRTLHLVFPSSTITGTIKFCLDCFGLKTLASRGKSWWLTAHKRSSVIHISIHYSKHKMHINIQPNTFSFTGQDPPAVRCVPSSQCVPMKFKISGKKWGTLLIHSIMMYHNHISHHITDRLRCVLQVFWLGALCFSCELLNQLHKKVFTAPQD